MAFPALSPLPGKKKGKHKPTPQEQALAQAQATAQKWLPFKDMHDDFLIRKDGAVVAGIKIAPFNLSLKSERERSSIIQSFQAVLNGLDVPWQLLSLYRPVDLDAYLGTLDQQATQVSGTRRRVLGDYERWVRQLAQQGGQVERRYYLLMTRNSKDAFAEHRTALRGLFGNLARIRGFRADMLDDALWRELLFLVFHAGQAATETVLNGGPRAVPLYHSQEESDNG